MKTREKNLIKTIQDKVNKNPIQIDWIGTDVSAKIVLEKGLQDLENELYEMNIDYGSEMESQYRKELSEEHEESIKWIEDNIDIGFDVNIKGYLCQCPDICVLVTMYSNYDCTNSMDSMDEGGYLSEIYKHVKGAVKKEDYMAEHANVYGACLFCFVTKMSIEDYLNIDFKKTVTIPHNTQYGFFGSFLGSGSQFEHATTKEITLKKQYGDTKYDIMEIHPDCLQSYSMSDVYGDTGFIKESNIIVK